MKYFLRENLCFYKTKHNWNIINIFHSDLSLFWGNILLKFSKHHSICSIIKVLVNISCGVWKFTAPRSKRIDFVQFTGISKIPKIIYPEIEFYKHTRIWMKSYCKNKLWKKWVPPDLGEYSRFENDISLTRYREIPESSVSPDYYSLYIFIKILFHTLQFCLIYCMNYNTFSYIHTV